MLNADITRQTGAGRQIDTAKYLDDVELAEGLLANASQNGGQLSHADIVFSLRNFLKMKYYPVAVKYFFSENELDDFTKNAAYKTALHPYTFCHIKMPKWDSDQREGKITRWFIKEGETHAG
jgi:hypothetical protein